MVLNTIRKHVRVMPSIHLPMTTFRGRIVQRVFTCKVRFHRNEIKNSVVYRLSKGVDFLRNLIGVWRTFGRSKIGYIFGFVAVLMQSSLGYSLDFPDRLWIQRLLQVLEAWKQNIQLCQNDSRRHGMEYILAKLQEKCVS